MSRQNAKFKVVIPARYASTRLPGKPLLEINGKSMIQHVYERARESAAEQIVVATDDQRIRYRAQQFGAEVCMTGSDHNSGSDRIAEVVETFGWSDDTIVVNLQGDEPLMPASLVDQVAMDMASHQVAGMTTLASRIHDKRTLFDPHVVKVVIDGEGYALYFSRAPIPWHRDEFVNVDEALPDSIGCLRHIWLYAYRAGYLKQFIAWPPAPVELAESLEQLRVLWHGGKIHVSLAAQEPSHGVDTLEDLQRVERVLAG